MSQTSPSVAVCLPDLTSLMTRDWMVSDRAGKANCLSRIFWRAVSYILRLLNMGIRTLIFPEMSDLTGPKAVEPRTSDLQISICLYHWDIGDIPKRVVRDSAASRNSLVLMALLLALSTGTSTKDFLTVLKKVSPGG